ncbi:MAG: hypothetical protein AAFO79_01605 [Pseudomonadota bacterium]
MTYRTFPKVAAAGVAGLLACAAVGAAQANQINTGGVNGAYFSNFCPPVSERLKQSQLDYACNPTAGSRENIERIADNPSEIGFAQADIYLLESQIAGAEKFQILRNDIARECLFIVTKNQEITSFGEVSALAEYVNFVLPPEQSGSAATFELLRQIDPNGLGKARNVTYARSTDEALDAALSQDDTFTLFVQFPNGNNPRFKKIAEQKGAVVPVLDRAILRQEVRGEKIYFAQQTEIENPKFVREAREVVTACTPIVLFTGASNLIEDDEARRDHQDLVRTVKAIPADDLRPQESFFRRMLRKARELSSKSVTKALDLAEEAREKAGPLIAETRKRAGEITNQAIDKAGELADQARKEGAELLDDAGRLAEEARKQSRALIGEGEGSGAAAPSDNDTTARNDAAPQVDEDAPAERPSERTNPLLEDNTAPAQ